MAEILIEDVVKIVLKELKNSDPREKQMSLKTATILVEAVQKKAENLGVRVVIAVSDAAGIPVVIHCMDDSYIGSYDVAVNKTYTAVAFKMSTRKLGELAKPGEALYGIQYTNQGKVVIFGGGEPLYIEKDLVGAIGVSGGSVLEDTELATYGKAIFEEVIKCQ